MAGCAPEQAWSALAGAIAGRPRVRVSRDGGRTYPAGVERDLTPELPSSPAAVLLFDDDASARCLAADFDVARGGRGQVDDDAAAFAELVHGCGGRTIADHSPSGGRHIYVLWARPVPITELRPALHALRALYPSLDTTPMTNPAAGCIRPPGARHRCGGHQVLDTPLPEALAVAASPCGPEVWAALLDRLGPQLAELSGLSGEAESAAEGSDAHAAGRHGATAPRRHGAGLSPRLERIATTGLYDLDRYASPSEARQAVITAAAAAGWTLADLAAQLERGLWPGLAGFYARYRPHVRRRAIAADWRKAQAWLGRENFARKSTTRVPPHTAGPSPAPSSIRLDLAGPEDSALTAYRWIRAWWNAVLATERIRYTGRAGLSVRLLLRSIGAMAQRRGTRYLDVGRRALALGCGLDDSTVSELLRTLREEDDPWIVLLENERGERGDLYELRIPDGALEVAAWRSWRAGRIDAIHPAFRALGPTRALVYEALTREPAHRRELTHDAALSPRTLDDALLELAEYGLAERLPGQGWRRGPADLDVVAERLGTLDRVAELVAEYAVEREAWRALHGAGRPLPRDLVNDDDLDLDSLMFDESGPAEAQIANAAGDFATSGPAPWRHGATSAAAALRAELDAIALLIAEFGAVPLDPDPLADPRYGVHGHRARPPTTTTHPGEEPAAG